MVLNGVDLVSGIKAGRTGTVRFRERISRHFVGYVCSRKRAAWYLEVLLNHVWKQVYPGLVHVDALAKRMS